MNEASVAMNSKLTIVAALNVPISVARAPDGNIFTVNAGSHVILRTPANTQEVVPFASGFTSFSGIAASSLGDLYETNSAQGTVTKSSPSACKNMCAAADMGFEGKWRLDVSTAIFY